MKTIIVTGGTGFIGSHLVERLLISDYQVIVPYIDIQDKSFFLQKDLDKKVMLESLDIRDEKKVFQFVKKHSPDYIFHLAAVTLVTDAYKDPLRALETNVMGTAHFLESVRNSNNIKGIIVASTDKAYGKTKEPYTEQSALKGDHPYDVSKSSADLITQAYFKTYNTPVIVTRFGNVYGEGDLHFDRIIPGICDAIIKRKTLEIRSDGTYIRDYLYVKDVVEGYMFLLNQFETLKGESFNFSSMDTFSVLTLVKKAEEVLKVTIPYKIMNNAQNEIPYQHLDDQKIRKKGWKNNYSIANTLENIFSWYKKYSKI